MDFLFAKELTKIDFKVASKSLIFLNKVIFWSKIIFWNRVIFWNMVNIVAHISLILSNKVNNVDFKGSEGFLEKVTVVSSKSSLKVINNKFNRI